MGKVIKWMKEWSEARSIYRSLYTVSDLSGNITKNMNDIWKIFETDIVLNRYMMPVYLSDFVIRLWKDLWRVYL